MNIPTRINNPKNPRLNLNTLTDCDPENKKFDKQTLELRLDILHCSEREGDTPPEPVKDMSE